MKAMASSSKRLSIIRHGQAMHNPRAEKAKALGCSMEEFLQLMREDDVLDAPLTNLGKKQASSVKLTASSSIDLVVSSPLSRALETADLVHPSTTTNAKRVCCEHFREVNGEMMNGKRRSKSELETIFPSWDFQDLNSDEDALWTPKMESFDAVAERGYQGLCWLMKRPEASILLVSHGGILRYMMNLHPLIGLEDKRSTPGKEVKSRFDNCEVRHYILSWNENEIDQKKIIMTEIDAIDDDE